MQTPQTIARVIEFAVRQPLLIKTETAEYRIEFPLSSVILAEELLGRALRSPADWFGAPAKDIPALLQAGLKKYHPDVTDEQIAEITDGLGPEGCTDLAEALGAVAFPRWLARYKENLDKLQAQGGAATGKAESVAAL